MIYLIDDKKVRQEKDYKWDYEKFDIYKEFIHPIYTLEELKEKSKYIGIANKNWTKYRLLFKRHF